MTDIIDEILSSHIYDDCQDSEELQALIEKDIALWRKLEPIIGLDRIDEIANNQSQIDHALYLQWFRRGIQLGAAVMLEVLK